MKQQLETKQKYKACIYFTAQADTKEDAEYIQGHPCIADIKDTQVGDLYACYKKQVVTGDDVYELIYQVSASIGCIYQAFAPVKMGKIQIFVSGKQFMVLDEGTVQSIKILHMLSKE